MTLHRPVLRMIKYEPDMSVIQVCTAAAKARVTSTIDFVRSLRAEHLQSFWYSASQYNFALLGTFLCLLNSTLADDAKWGKEKLEEYKWILRLSSKSADFLDRAISTLTLSTTLMAADGRRQPIETSRQARDEDESDEEEYHPLSEDRISQLSPVTGTDAHLEQSWFDFGSPLARFDLNEAGGLDPNFMYAEEPSAPMSYVGVVKELPEH